VHELLTRDDLDTVSVKRVSESLLAATQQSVVPPDKKVHMSVDGDEFVLPLHQATSMSLVLNELVQNAVEHGFRTLNEGRIHIQLTAGDAEMRVTVSNDGAQLPPGFTPRQSDSLGLSIVETLVRGDLQGTFTLENSPDGKGILAIVSFPADGKSLRTSRSNSDGTTRIVASPDRPICRGRERDRVSAADEQRG
jgi:two-component sensor histidine kinase